MKINPIIALDECVVLYDAEKIPDGKFNARKFLSDLLRVRKSPNLLNFLLDKNTLQFATYISKSEMVWEIKNMPEEFDFPDNSHLGYLINSDNFAGDIVKANLEYLDDGTDLGGYFGFRDHQCITGCDMTPPYLDRESKAERERRIKFERKYGNYFKPNLKFISLFELAAIKSALTLLIELHAISCDKYGSDTLFRPIEDIKDAELLEQIGCADPDRRPLYVVDIGFFARHPFLIEIDEQKLMHDLLVEVEYKPGFSKPPARPEVKPDLLFVYETYTSKGLNCDEVAIKRSASGSIVAAVVNALRHKSVARNYRFTGSEYVLGDENEEPAFRALYSEIASVVIDSLYGFCEVCGRPLVHSNVNKGKQRRLTCSDSCRVKKCNEAKEERD